MDRTVLCFAVEVSRNALTSIPVSLFKEIPPSHIKQMRPEVFSVSAPTDR